MAFVGILCFFVLIVGIIATIKGGIPELRIKDRKTAVIVTIISFIVFMTLIETDSDTPEEAPLNDGQAAISMQTTDNEEDSINELLEFKGTMELKVDGDTIIMSIASNVPDGGIFEVALTNASFDVLNDYIEIKDGKIEKVFEVPDDWEIGYYSGLAMFRFNLEDRPQPDHIKEIYGDKGEKMLGEQAIETYDGGFYGNIEIATVAYPDEETIQQKLDELFIQALQELIEASNGIIKKIETDGDWRIVLVTVDDAWYYSLEHEKERFAETVGGTIETIVKNAGKVDNDGVVHVYFYDAYGKELASPKILGGYKIKR